MARKLISIEKKPIYDKYAMYDIVYEGCRAILHLENRCRFWYMMEGDCKEWLPADIQNIEIFEKDFRNYFRKDKLKRILK